MSNPVTGPMATRTLLAAGYEITGVHRQPNHIEYQCERISRLNVAISHLIAITARTSFTVEEATDIVHAAKNQNRVAVLVSEDGTENQLSFAEFLDALGGAVPSWRALGKDFDHQLQKASLNEQPEGTSGEAWQIFENLIADGLEFCLGRHVNRLGGNKRGKRVSDMIAVLPDFDVLVVDAKAAAAGFDVTWPSLRALVEYVEKQKIRQQGGGDVIAAVVFSSKFRQDDDALNEVARSFLGETRIPLSFVEAQTLGCLVQKVRSTSDIRNKVRWKMLFNGGRFTKQHIDREIEAAIVETCNPREL